MSTLKNSVQLMGHLGKDPEVLNLDSGKKLVKFSLATNDNYTKKDGEKVTTTDWHQVIAWGKTAEIIEKYVTKGKEVIVRGKLSNRSYDTKEGEKRYITEINCQEIVMTSASNQ